MSDRHLDTCHKSMWGGYCDCRPRSRMRKSKKNIIMVTPIPKPKKRYIQYLSIAVPVKPKQVTGWMSKLVFTESIYMARFITNKKCAIKEFGKENIVQVTVREGGK